MSDDPTMEIILDCVRVLESPLGRVLPEHVATARLLFTESLRVLTEEGVGDDKKNLQGAAKSFDFYAKLTLKGAGYSPTRARIAEVLGENPAHYSGTMSGKSGSAMRVLSWLTKWDISAPPIRVWTPPPPKEAVVKSPAMSREWFAARGCPLPEPNFQSDSMYDARVEEAQVALGRAKVEKDVTWVAFKRSRIFLMNPTESVPAKAFLAASDALVSAQRVLERAKQDRTLFREDMRRATASSSEPVVNSRPSLAGLAEMEATAQELVGCYKQIIYAPSLELEFLVATARRYDALARALLHREGRDERQRYIAYLVGERGAEYLSVIFGKLASREHLLRWWSNWPLFTLDAEEKVEFLPVPSR